MLVVGLVLGPMIAVDLVSYAVTGEIAYIGLGIIGWRKFRRGDQGP